jgi:hypothetical protein
MNPATGPGSTLRYLVLLPALARPVGGTNVLMWLVEKLNKAGYMAAVLYPSQDYSYDFKSFAGARYYSPDLDLILRTGFFKRGIWEKARHAIRELPRYKPGRMGLRSRQKLPIWQPGPEDVLVVSEFMYPEALSVFGGRRCILCVQDVFGLLHARQRSPLGQMGGSGQFEAIFSTSQASARAARAVFGTSGGQFTLPVCRSGLTYNPDKKLQIALMPRKRRDETRMLVSLIKAHPVLSQIDLVVIDGIPDEAEVHRLVRESLIFLSFSDREGFGLPPAEAMATGSLVIGYTGVGGEEYFTSETGFPIPDRDIIAFIDRLAEVVSLWQVSRTALDLKRLEASRFIWSRYNEVVAEQSLLELWSEIDAKLR